MPRTDTHFKEQYELSPGIWEPLFESIIDGDEFKYWQLDENSWPLRVVGGPGSGKIHVHPQFCATVATNGEVGRTQTTLAAMIARQIRGLYNSSNQRVASIFIGSHLESNDSNLSMILDSILNQLRGSNINFPPKAKPESICEIRDTLQLLLRSLDRSFLIIDGADRYGQFPYSSLENELLALRSIGLKVMLTSRSLEACYLDADRCPECHSHQSFTQPYERCRIDMGPAVSRAFEDFISWDLENEHGDLGLGSRNDSKPPLSRFGAALRDSRRPKAALWLRDDIRDRSDYNVALARLRIDAAPDNMPRIDNIEEEPGPPPPAVIAFFNAGFEAVRTQPETQSRLGIAALSMWVSEAKGRKGVPAEVLLSRLASESALFTKCTVGEVIDATQGLLTIVPAVGSLMQPFTSSFIWTAASTMPWALK